MMIIPSFISKWIPFISKGIPLVLESDLLNAPIIGYTNNIAGIPIGTLLDKECIIKICE